MQQQSETNPTNSTAPLKYIVDKTIYNKLPLSNNGIIDTSQSPQSTPSVDDGIPSDTEKLHRLHGTSLILDASTLLCLPPSTYATACTIFHRMYSRISLKEYCVWSMAIACILLAGKVEEEPRTVQSIILTFTHIYRRRRLRIGDDMTKYSYDGTTNCEAELASELTNEEKENVIRSVKPLSQMGPVYQEWKETLFNMENVILKNLGFTLNWIPDSHPHKFILYVARVLDIESKEVAQQAWNYCNDSCCLDLCCKYDPEVTACAAILLATSKHNVELPLVPRPWWEVFIGPNRNEDLTTVCNAILAVGDDEKDMDVRRAKYGFIPSLLKDPSFIDPESYLWSVSD